MTEDQLIEDLRTAYCVATADLTPRADLARDVRRRHRQQSRRAGALLATPLVLGGAAFATIGFSGQSHPTHIAATHPRVKKGAAQRLTGPVVQLAAYKVRLPASTRVDSCTPNSVSAEGPDGGAVKVMVLSGQVPTDPGSQQSVTVAGYAATLTDVPTVGVLGPFFQLVVSVPTSTDPSRVFVVIADGIDQNTIIALAAQAISSPNNGSTTC